MTAPIPSVQEIVNDQNYTPLGVNAAGDVLCTEDGTVIIVSSRLRYRGSRILQKYKWLQPPPFNVRIE